MSWLRALKGTARSGLTVERTRLEPLVALRGAAGVAIVIGLSLWLVSPAAAASSAFGAFSAGTATFQRSWRPRPVVALAAGGGLAVSTFLGYVAGAHPVLFVLLLAVWTFLAGMAWAVGPTSGFVAASTVGVMLVTVTLPTTVMGAAGHAAVIAFGGLVQALLIIVFPVRRWGAQRDALADAFAAEADYARRLRHDPIAPFDPEPLMTARSAAAVTPWQARRRPAELHGSRGLAERIRPVLASLADPAVGAASEGPERDRARALLGAAASVLDAAAHAIRHGTPAKLPSSAVEVLRMPDSDPDAEGELTGAARRTAGRLLALLGEVTETADGTRTSNAAKPTVTKPMLRPTMPSMVPVAIRAVRHELRWESPIFRHALRLCAVASAGYLLASVLPLGHPYWAPMCSVMVMRPDFSQTYERGVARLAGTLVGVTVATGVVQLASPGAQLSALFAVASIALMYLLLRTGYAVAQACVAAYVVFLLGMGGTEWTQTVPDRVLLTLLGGLLAMLSYALFPAWETPKLHDRLAEWLEVTGRYAATVVESFADPEGWRRGDVRKALLAAREAHADWDQALARAKAEPVRHQDLTRTDVDDAQQAMEAAGRVAMLMEAHLPERLAQPVPAAEQLAKVLREATEEGAQAVRDRRVPNWDALSAAIDAWEGEGVPSAAVIRRGAGLFLDALEELTEAIGGTPEPGAGTEPGTGAEQGPEPGAEPPKA
ncbi:FUSC family protein [Streptomyces sp. H27-D2]|uniref:FUSC family protein n=1 Tax=Streptomyces sp. H27-D2 TaxID=3046304 RepID=UPI002DB876C1|nr:FUSC family protein [Streptomyces sp. H27-D2]MEC4018224.1 FUSC family protein [Streptomyces sp. H27-D2]